MTTVTITITDKPDGQVNVKMEFDPEVSKDDPGTPAPGVAAMEAIMAHAAGDVEDLDDDDEDPDFDEDDDDEE